MKPEKLLVIVPSRGRPDNAHQLLSIWNTFHTDATLLLCLDEDDPKLEEYPKCNGRDRLETFIGPPRQFVKWTNLGAVLAMTEKYKYVGSMTDKHVPRVSNWVRQVTDALDEWNDFGFVYPNDGIFREEIPTACFMTTNVVRALGWMAMPKLQHFACDNIWKHLGLATGRIRYLPRVTIEMMHAAVGKSAYDLTQQNSDKLRAIDLPVYEKYMREEFFEDVEKLNTLLK